MASVTYVMLRKFSVEVVASKVAESINDVILDAQNKVLADCEATHSKTSIVGLKIWFLLRCFKNLVIVTIVTIFSNSERILGRDHKACQENVYVASNESSCASKKSYVKLF